MPLPTFFIEVAESGWLGATLPKARSPFVAGAQQQFGLTPGLLAVVLTAPRAVTRPRFRRLIGGEGWYSDVDERGIWKSPCKDFVYMTTRIDELPGLGLRSLDVVGSHHKRPEPRRSPS